MTRATRQQRAARLNAAFELRRHHSAAAAARQLAAQHTLSMVQARRYVRAAAAMEAPVAEAPIMQPITVRLPRPLVEQLRARTHRTGRSLGALVAQALTAFLSRGP